MDKLIEELRAVLGGSAVLSEPDELLVYECDGLPQHKYRPRAVVFPSSTEETAAVMRVLARARVPFTPRGAGTGLSGGALALNHGVVIEMARMRKILKVDEANRIAVVQPGVVNSHVSRAVAHLGLHYVPDPSSQPTCTIGGNIAESAGGVHCLKYGTTTDHVLGVRVVLAGGEIVDLGGGGTERPGYDLLGVFVGAEGTFGIATEATLRLVPLPPAVRTMLAEFAEVNDASHAVSAIIAGGIMPAGLEMMDREIIRAVEASVFAAGLPLDVGAALLIELDGIEAGLDEEAERVKAICLQYGARKCRLARDEHERKKLWAARKGAFGAIGRISPDSMIQDAVVPRSRLPEVLDAAYQIAAKYQLRIANVFHAGDGNLHPLICFDSRFPEEVHRVKEAGRELMETCVRAGGSITGEHGVGLDKRELLSLIFSEADMGAMLEVRAAFDPTGLCNPGKIIPMLRGCGEARATQSPKTGNAGVSPASSNGFTHDKVEPFNPADVALHEGGRDAHGPSKSGARIASRTFESGSASLQLASIVGEENISASPHLRVSPSPLIVSPGSIEEVCEVMKLATSEGWTVVPAGGMTWLDAGQSLSNVNLILSTQKLNRIIEHEPADLVAITQTGVTLKDFNESLATRGQWLPIDPPNDIQGRASIGGVVATGLGGAQQFGYGAPRRHVIGMKIVRADGSVIKVGGRVVKNVAGYDLCKLFTGSYGTLGVIVEVNFKLRPLPTETKTVMAWGPGENLLLSAQGIIKTGLFPVAVELLSPGLAREAGWSNERDHLLLMRFAGSPNAVAQQVKRASELLAGAHARGPGCFAEDDSVVWKSLAALPSRFMTGVVWRVGAQPNDVGQLLALIERAKPSESLWQAGVGDGRIRVVECRESADNDSEESQVNLIERVRELRAYVESLGGSLIIEHALAAVKNMVSAWGDFGSARGIMKRVKQQLDPHGILSPGRFGF
ncbi:MAG TPA: FAD-linked oxidase C-terminal domain-containing protein [Pyrinomonadaceae bacterium]|nr:FAD-linked oxidase C-terminal domain-containing protein [Pyrinomonadaceae bacterium]